MNFLAHLHLSGSDPDILAGNFLGDFTRKKLMEQYPAKIQYGVKLHRAIDEFTDSHELVKNSIDLLRPSQKKYAPVLIDIYYDHFLAKNWKNYHDRHLADFADNCYSTLNDYQAYFTPKAQRFFSYLSAGNVLTAYAETEGIDFVLNGMSRRASFPNNLDNGVIHLKRHYDELEQDFIRFYPELMKFAAEIKPRLHEI